MTLNTDNSKHQLLVLSPSTPISSCTQQVSQLHLTRFFLCYLSVCLAVWPKTEHESVMTVRIILLMTQSRSTISSTRHWSRQAKGASLLISADNRGDTLLCTSLNVAMRGLSQCLRSIQAIFLQHTRLVTLIIIPGTIGPKRTRPAPAHGNKLVEIFKSSSHSSQWGPSSLIHYTALHFFTPESSMLIPPRHHLIQHQLEKE